MILSYGQTNKEENFSRLPKFFEAKLGNMYQFMEKIADRSATLTKMQLDFSHLARPENFCVGFRQEEEQRCNRSNSSLQKDQLPTFAQRSGCSFDAQKASNPLNTTRKNCAVACFKTLGYALTNGSNIPTMGKSARVTKPGTKRLVGKYTVDISDQYSEIEGGFNYAF